ncbi:hypothetical protein CK203_086291 [Vitis vinifera]|uniref:Uncharacterized protein n=1 Tax=Vitis vinifera TaxID=29760 RepID=A0A438EDS6_VITVI|nr:hypothetical protein CK203_086291 [Vitis vinifera]
MATLLYFEEKVHMKKLLRTDAIPLLFPRLLYQILEHLGYPFEPQLERRCICREIFTFDKWTSMTTYDAQARAPARPEHPEIPQPEHLEEPQQVEIPTDIRAPAPTVPSTGPMPEVASSAPSATPKTPLIVPAASKPHPSESSIAISISEFRGLCHTLRTLTATQNVLAQQMAAIPAFGYSIATEHDMPIPSEPTDPSHDPSLAEQTMTPKETTTGQIEASIPSTQLL